MLKEKNNSVIFTLHIKPASRTNEMVVYENKAQLKITAPPVDGKANKAVIDFLAKYFDIPKSSMKIILGESNRTKVIQISGFSIDYISSKLDKQTANLIN